MQIQAQAEAKPAPRALSAEANLLRRIAAFQQTLVSSGGVLHRSREPVLRGQAVGGAENPHPAFVRQNAAEAQGIFQPATGIAPAVEVQHNALPPQVLRQHPGSGKRREIMALHPHPGMLRRPHQLPQSVLPLPERFQGAVCQKRLHMGQLPMHQFRG